MFKFKTIGAFKQVINNPRTKAAQDLIAGLAVIPNDATKLAPTPATLTDAKSGVWFVGNIIDKPDLYNKNDFKVATGEYVLAYEASTIPGLPVEIDALVLSGTIASLAVGDVLVPNSDGSGKWVKADGTTIVASQYKINLKITEKTTYNGSGLVATVLVN